MFDDFQSAKCNTDFDDDIIKPGVCSIAATAAAIVGAAAIGAYSSNRASKAQGQAAQQGVESNERIAQMQIDAQNAMFDKQQELQKPFRDIGLNAQNKLVGMLNGKYARDFSMADYEQDPGYAFRLKQGMKGLESTAAARGGLLSGNALRAASQYNQDMASQEYQNAFNRYQTNRANQLQPWQSLAGVGQTATNVLGNAASQQGAGISNALGQLGQGNAQAYSDMGNARASGYVGATNAITGALGQYLNYNQGQQMVNSLRGGGGGSPYGGGGFNYGASAGLSAPDYYSAF